MENVFPSTLLIWGVMSGGAYHRNFTVYIQQLDYEVGISR